MRITGSLTNCLSVQPTNVVGNKIIWEFKDFRPNKMKGSSPYGILHPFAIKRDLINAIFGKTGRK